MGYDYIRRGRKCYAARGNIVRPGNILNLASQGWERYDWVDSVTKGDNIPDWRRRIALVRSATTGLSGERKEVKIRGGYFSYTQFDIPSQTFIETFRHGLMGYLPTFPVASSLSETKANNAALVSFVKRAQAVTNSFQGSVAVGELGETLRMIKNPAQGFRRGLDDYLDTVKKRARSRKTPGGRRPSKRSLRRMVADTWLEKAFGWDPLLNDVRTAAETLARRKHEWRRETVKIRAGGSDYSSTCVNPAQGLYAFLADLHWHQTRSEVNVKYYGVVKREVYNDYTWDMDLFGFNPRSFVPTVWELIPYSFLVDYFTNIGDIINAYAFNSSKLAWCNKGVRKHAHLIATWRNNYKYAQDQLKNSTTKVWVNYVEDQPKLELKHVTVNRSTYSGSFVPTIEFEIPGLGTKWINLSALLLGHADARRAISRMG